MIHTHGKAYETPSFCYGSGGWNGCGPNVWSIPCTRLAATYPQQIPIADRYMTIYSVPSIRAKKEQQVIRHYFRVGCDFSEQTHICNVGNTIINHQFGNDLYHLFMMTLGVGGLLLFYQHYIITYIYNYIYIYYCMYHIHKHYIFKHYCLSDILSNTLW